MNVQCNSVDRLQVSLINFKCCEQAVRVSCALTTEVTDSHSDPNIRTSREKGSIEPSDFLDAWLSVGDSHENIRQCHPYTLSSCGRVSDTSPLVASQYIR